MKSKIQMVLDAEKKKRFGGSKISKSRSQGGAANDAAEPGVALQSVNSAQLEFQAMEVNGILPALDDKAAITAYKMLRTRVLQRMRSNNWRTLIVTAAGVGDGKTVTACNLSVSIANDVNQSVILVDLDLQRPSIASSGPLG